MQDLTLETIIAIHDRILAKDGGDSRILSEGNLHQLVFRANLIDDVRKRAAFVFYSLCVFPVFREGNRRTACRLTKIFLDSDADPADMLCEDLRGLAHGIDAFTVEIEDVEQFLLMHAGKTS
jgi:hypothetical protein